MLFWFLVEAFHGLWLGSLRLEDRTFRDCKSCLHVLFLSVVSLCKYIWMCVVLSCGYFSRLHCGFLWTTCRIPFQLQKELDIFAESGIFILPFCFLLFLVWLQRCCIRFWNLREVGSCRCVISLSASAIGGVFFRRPMHIRTWKIHVSSPLKKMPWTCQIGKLWLDSFTGCCWLFHSLTNWSITSAIFVYWERKTNQTILAVQSERVLYVSCKYDLFLLCQKTDTRKPTHVK